MGMYINPWKPGNNGLIALKLQLYPQGAEVGGGGGTQQSFTQGDSTVRSKTLPFYFPFLTEKLPRLQTFHKKIVTLSYTY